MNTKPCKYTVTDLLNSSDIAKLIIELEFEEGMNLLEQLCEQVESGALPLKSAVTCYERGVTLLNSLRNQLSEAETKISKIEARG
jgi:exodeoxyribonuclease VII small subunit